MESIESYGEAKVACEQAVVETFGPERSALVRAGLVAGHGDPSDRAGYWPMRFAHPAGDHDAVLVPDSPALGMQLVDVEDLAEWIVLLATVTPLVGLLVVMLSPVLAAYSQS